MAKLGTHTGVHREESLILTHNSPTVAAGTNDPRHAGIKIFSAFGTDLIPGHIDLKQVIAWVCGHTHYNSDIQARVSSNRGICFVIVINFQRSKSH